MDQLIHPTHWETFNTHAVRSGAASAAYSVGVPLGAIRDASYDPGPPISWRAFERHVDAGLEPARSADFLFGHLRSFVFSPAHAAMAREGAGGAGGGPATARGGRRTSTAFGAIAGGRG